MGFFDFFTGKKAETIEIIETPQSQSKQTLTISEAYKIFGSWVNAISSSNSNIYEINTVRNCIHALADNTAKLNCEVYRTTSEGFIYDEPNNRLQRKIEQQPNPYMNGKDFLYKLRTLYELDNNVYIFIDRDINRNVIALYPIPYSQVELLEYNGGIYYKFYLQKGYKEFIRHFDDIACLRQYYARDLFYGDSNTNTLKQPLETLHATNEAILNASKTSGQLRGLIKATNAMLDSESLKEMRDDFVKDYLNTGNESGIAGIDSKIQFEQLKGDYQIINVAQRKELRDDVYRAFGVNDKIIMSDFDDNTWEAFYKNKLEPFALALSLELTNKIFTERERGVGNVIMFSSSRLGYASTETKLKYTALSDRAIITSNEYRGTLGLKPKENGDSLVIRKEYANFDKLDEVQGVTDKGGGDELKGGDENK